MAAITVSHISRTYRLYEKEPGLRGSLKSLIHRQTVERHAVVDISFSIEPGEVVGFLGPNGAGKTTTLKMLCGILYPSAGAIDVLGYTPAHRDADYLRRIALVMGQKTLLWWDIPAMETLLVHKEMYRLSDQQFHRNVGDLAAMLEVESLLRVPVRALSLGERMKMELLAALVHRPAVLFLDEPTIGLDVVAQQRVRAFLHDLNQTQGTTIMLTSHDMDDIEAVCPRVLLIDQGRVRFDGALRTLVTQTSPHKMLTVVFANPVPLAEVRAALAGLPLLPSDDPLRLKVAVPREQVADIASGLLRIGPVSDLSVEDEPVEEIIATLFCGQAMERRKA
jgi:ABC-2 type transport system ATP-binding protein